MRGKDKWHKILVLTGLLYTFCLFQILGISMNEKDWQISGVQSKKEQYSADKKESEEALNYIKTSVTEEPPKIAITFDDGPSESTERLLDGLKERGVRATFFLIGASAKKYPELVKRMDEEGHLIGNHTYHHVDITRMSDEEARKEIMETNDVIYSITGKGTEYMRPPFGVMQRKLELELDVFPVMWTIDTLET